jgi:hypothetical protein
MRRAVLDGVNIRLSGGYWTHYAQILGRNIRKQDYGRFKRLIIMLSHKFRNVDGDYADLSERPSPNIQSQALSGIDIGDVEHDFLSGFQTLNLYACYSYPSPLIEMGIGLNVPIGPSGLYQDQRGSRKVQCGDGCDDCGNENRSIFIPACMVVGGLSIFAIGFFLFNRFLSMEYLNRPMNLNLVAFRLFGAWILMGMGSMLALHIILERVQ